MFGDALSGDGRCVLTTGASTGDQVGDIGVGGFWAEGAGALDWFPADSKT